MTTFYGRPPVLSAAFAVRPADLMRRRPQRLSATVPWEVLKRLQERADHEGRSLSSLVSHLLEVATS